MAVALPIPEFPPVTNAIAIEIEIEIATRRI
jgi:hypothetical protein